MQIEISKIKTQDLKQAQEFCLFIFEELGWDKNFVYGFDNLKKFFGGQRETFFLAKEKEKIIACAGLKELSEAEGLIKRFYVAKEFRGKGLADLMLRKIKQFAKEKNYKTIVLDIFKDNIRAKKFFKKQRFVVFSPEPQENWIESQYPKIFAFGKLEL